MSIEIDRLYGDTEVVALPDMVESFDLAALSSGGSTIHQEVHAAMAALNIDPEAASRFNIDPSNLVETFNQMKSAAALMTVKGQDGPSITPNLVAGRADGRAYMELNTSQGVLRMPLLTPDEDPSLAPRPDLTLNEETAKALGVTAERARSRYEVASELAAQLALEEFPGSQVIAVPELVKAGDGREPYFRIVEVYADESKAMQNDFITSVPVERNQAPVKADEHITTSEGRFRRSDWDRAKESAEHLQEELGKDWRGEAEVTFDQNVHVINPLNGEDAAPHFQVKITANDGVTAQFVMVPIDGPGDRGQP